MVPFWVLFLIRHLVFRGPKRGQQFRQPPMYRPFVLWCTCQCRPQTRQASKGCCWNLPADCRASAHSEKEDFTDDSCSYRWHVGLDPNTFFRLRNISIPYMHRHMCIHAYTYIYIYTNTHTCVCVFVVCFVCCCLRVLVFGCFCCWLVCLRILLQFTSCLYMYICIYIYICICMCACTRAYLRLWNV